MGYPQEKYPSEEMKLEIWRQILDSVTLCFWCPFCIWPSEKQMHKKYRTVRDSRNSIQHWIHVVAIFLNFLIQKSSRFLACILLVPCLLVSFYCSINVNFACSLKFWPGNSKCWSAWDEFCLFTSFWWLFNRKLKVVSDLQVYCLLHNTHSIRYIRFLFLQLSLLYILRVLCVTVLLKVFVDCTCVQPKLFHLELQVFE